MLVATVLNSFRNHPIGRGCNYGKLHAFLQIGVPASFDVHRVVANILDPEYRGLHGRWVVSINRSQRRTIRSLGADWDRKAGAEGTY